MAIRAQPLTLLQWTGAVMAALVFLAITAPLAAVAWRAEETSVLGAADWSAIRFTVSQAAISAFLSVVLAIPVARALARQRFAGRGLVVALMGAPFLLPVIVAILGLLAVFGRNGWVNAGLGLLGLPPLEIYGMHGVVLAHVFFNLPLAVRLLLQGWMSIPSERFRLAVALGFSNANMRQHFEWPLLRMMVPGVFLVIFLICSTSFAVALTLGGGPRATTVELAIYQAFRFDFDLGRAALLGLVQVAICAFAAVAVLGVAVPQVLGAGLDRAPVMWPEAHRHRFIDGAAVLSAALFLMMPMIALGLRGVPALPTLPAVAWEAAGRSVVLSFATAVVAVAMALPLAALIARGRARSILELVGSLSIAVSPLVVGTGLFLLLFPVVNPTLLAIPVTGLVNALAALPFLLRALVPAITEAELTQGRLATALGMRGWPRFRIAILPRLRRPLGFGAGLAAALSMGDLGVIALFSAPSQGTLPLEMYRLMGAYRTDDAQGAALLLLLLSLGIFWLFDRGGRLHAAT